MLKEVDVRKQVEILKWFYMDSFIFVIVNAVLILLWILYDRDTTFWPKYVFIISGVGLLFKAYQMGILTFVFHHFSFFTEEWEERKIKELIGSQGEQKKIALNRYRKKSSRIY